MKNISAVYIVVRVLFCILLLQSVSTGDTNSGPPIIQSYYYSYTSHDSNNDDVDISVSIDPNGASTTAHLEWGQTYALGEVTLETPVTEWTATFALDSLPINTVFYFKIIATNSYGTTVSAIDSFGTRSTLPPPGATTLPPESITRSSALLRGICPANERSLFAFFMVQTADGTSQTIVGSFSIPPALSDTLVAFNWTGLLPGTEYGYRLRVAYANQLGNPPASHGELVSFTTQPDSMIHSLVIPILINNYATVLARQAAYVNIVAYIGVHSYGTRCLDWALGESELPPLPPFGSADFRFTGNCMGLGAYFDIRKYEHADQADTYRVRFQFDEATVPVVVSWPDLRESYRGKVSMLVNGTAVDMKESTSVTLESTDPGVIRIIASKPIAPTGRPCVMVRTWYIVTTATGAHMDAIVLPNGVPTSAWFEWGKTSFENKTSIENLGNGASGIPIVTDLTGLDEGQAYRIRPVLSSGDELIYGVDQTLITKTTTSVPDETFPPSAFRLAQNYPNPFNPATEIKFQIAEPQFVTLKIYNIMGKEITTLVNEEKQPGSYSATWDASGHPSGVYYYRLSAGGFSETRKLVLMK